MQRLIAVLLVIILFLPVLPGYAQDNGKQLTIAMQPPETLDPVLVSRFDLDARDLLENLFVGLTRFDARRGQIVPYLAESWELSQDGLTWTFSLRDDIMWMDTNGEVIRAVTAGDVVFAIQRACDPRRPSPITTNLAIIEGCLSLQHRLDLWVIDQAMLDDLIGVSALDETTVEFRLLFPAAYFLTLTALPEYRPLPAELVPDEGAYPQATNLATSGPWIVDAWDGQHMILEANLEWPLERQGDIERVEIRFDLDLATTANRLVGGTLDVARIEQAGADIISVNHDDMIRDRSGQTIWLVGFSYELELPGNPLVRRALSAAIDRDAVARQLGVIENNVYEGVSRFTPLTAIAAPSVAGAGFNATQAQELLAQAGYPQCANFPVRLSLAVANEPVSLAIGQAIIQQWQTNLGCAEGVFELIPVSRQSVVDNAHSTLDTAETARFTMWLISWTADYPDANAWITDALHCDFGVLRTGRSCNNTDTQLNQAGIMSDITSRINTYTQAETEFFGSAGEFPVIPVVMPREIWAQQQWLEGVASYGPFQFDRWLLANH